MPVEGGLLFISNRSAGGGVDHHPAEWPAAGVLFYFREGFLHGDADGCAARRPFGGEHPFVVAILLEAVDVFLISMKVVVTQFGGNVLKNQQAGRNTNG